MHSVRQSLLSWCCLQGMASIIECSTLPGQLWSALHSVQQHEQNRSGTLIAISAGTRSANRSCTFSRPMTLATDCRSLSQRSEPGRGCRVLPATSPATASQEPTPKLHSPRRHLPRTHHRMCPQFSGQKLTPDLMCPEDSSALL